MDEISDCEELMGTEEVRETEEIVNSYLISLVKQNKHLYDESHDDYGEEIIIHETFEDICATMFKNCTTNITGRNSFIEFCDNCSY